MVLCSDHRGSSNSLAQERHLNRESLSRLVCLLLLIAACSCERSTTVQTTGEDPPGFVLAGSGKLGQIVIYEAGYRGSLFDESHRIWEVKAERMPGKLIKDLGTITYGTIPEGYLQVKPEPSQAPPQLSEGKTYKFWFISANAPTALGYFEIRNNKAVIVESWH